MLKTCGNLCLKSKFGEVRVGFGKVIDKFCRKSKDVASNAKHDQLTLEATSKGAQLINQKVTCTFITFERLLEKLILDVSNRNASICTTL